jgi:hypothetical protein
MTLGINGIHSTPVYTECRDYFNVVIMINVVMLNAECHRGGDILPALVHIALAGVEMFVRVKHTSLLS